MSETLATEVQYDAVPGAESKSLEVEGHPLELYVQVAK